MPAVDFEVRRGETWGLCGPNGGGKSTLLRTLLGLQPVVAGEARWSADARLAYVGQRGAIDRTVPARVADFVREGAESRWSFLSPLGSAAKKAVASAIEDCELAGLQRMPMGHLSEGQRQRALVARALASEPNVLVLDEPTSAMDVDNERAIFDLLARLRDERQLTVLVASHQLRLLVQLATHAALVDKDRRLALAAPIDEVLGSLTWCERYGSLATPGERDALG